MAHPVSAVSNAKEFETPDGSSGIGHEFVALLQREGAYGKVADPAWAILKDWTKFYENDAEGKPIYVDTFSGVRWERNDVHNATELFLTEKVVRGLSFFIPQRGTAWEAFVAAAIGGQGFATRLFLRWAGITFPYSMTELAKARGFEAELARAREATKRIALAYYEMLRYDGWMEDNDVPFVFDNYRDPETGLYPDRLKPEELFRQDYDVDRPIMTRQAWERLDMILWDFVDRELIYGFIVAKMEIVDTSLSSIGGETA